jgi:hypothetical protein
VLDGVARCVPDLAPHSASDCLGALCVSVAIAIQKPLKNVENKVEQTGTNRVVGGVSERGVYAASMSNLKHVPELDSMPREPHTPKRAKARAPGTLKKGPKTKRNKVEQTATNRVVGNFKMKSQRPPDARPRPRNENQAVRPPSSGRKIDQKCPFSKWNRLPRTANIFACPQV